MPRRIWQWLKRFFQRLFGTSRQSSRRRRRSRNLPSSSTVREVNAPETPSLPPSPRGSNQNTSPPSTGRGVNSTPTATDYEVLFNQLLEGVKQGWSRGNIDGFLIGRRINKAELAAWVRRFGDILLATPTQHEEIARRMVRLGEIYGEELGKVVGEIGRQLLALIPPPPPSPINNEDGRDNIWNGEVIEAVFRGNGLSTPAQRTAEVAESITENIAETNDLYERGVLQFQAGNYDAALNYFDSALALDPYVPKVWEKRSSVLQKLGRYAEAIASNNAASSLYRGDQNPQLPTIERNAEASSEQGQLDTEPQQTEALPEQEQLEAETQDAEALFEQSKRQYDEGDFQEAVASYDKALAIKPDNHVAWNNQAIALFKLGRFNDAIASYDKALAIKPDDPKAWNNRGIALRNLERSEDAIASYDKALAIKPDSHEAWINRANALRNLERFFDAIASFDKALAIKSDTPEVWNNRGITQNDLGEFEEAIASFDKALAIKADDPEAWNNRGLALSNLGRVEEAIACFDKALAIEPDFQEAWIYRGIATAKSPNYNPLAAEILQMQFPRSPAVTPNSNLNQRGYEGQLLCYQEGLRHCPQNTHPEGWGLLHKAIGNAHYFRGQIDSHQSYWRKAVTSYNQALQTLTKDAFPSLYLEVLQDLIKALLGLGQIPEAKQLQREGTDLLRRLLNNPPWTGGLRVSDSLKKELALKFASFQQFAVDIAVQTGQLIEALETAEAGKNACLTWLLYGYGQEISSPKYAEILQLLNPKTAAVYWHISPSALTTFIIKHGEAAPIVLAKTESLNRLVKFENWVKDWNQKYADYRQGKTPLNSPVDGGKQENSLPAGGDVLDEVKWRDNLPEMLSKLSEILDIPAIELVISGITHLILIPHRDLHRFPLHALFSGNYTITYLPSAQIGINLVGQASTEIGRQDARPTEQIGRQDAQIGINLVGQVSRLSTEIGRQDARPTEQLLSIEHPESTGLPPLLYAEIESSLISQIFGNPTRVSGADVTLERLETELKKPYNIFHFNGHGNYNFHNPSQSALALSGDEKLTLKEIVQMSFSGYQIISLSACETAVTGNQNITTEYVGLVSSFLRQGASYVLSTLWTVNEIPAALFVIRFYQLFAAGATPPVALKHAKHWLRTLTYPNLLVWYLQLATDKLQETDYGCWQSLRSFARNIQNDSDKMNSSQPPFNHPFYWAGFTITGKVNS